VYPDERDYLDLETGEVFENPRYAKSRKHLDKLISGQLSVVEASSEADFKYNEMSYLGEVKGEDYHSPTSIYFPFFLHPRPFHNLLTNIRNGLLPTTVQINLPLSVRKEDSSPPSIRMGARWQWKEMAKQR
jgi:hypothetical protein